MDHLLPLLQRIANQVFDIEKKLGRTAPAIDRNIERIKAAIEEAGLLVHNPLGEAYNELRTDCEASIAGSNSHNLAITDVLKPVIYKAEAGGARSLVQKAVVIAEAKK